MGRICHYQAFGVLAWVHHHHVRWATHWVVIQLDPLRQGLAVGYHVLLDNLRLVTVLAAGGTCRNLLLFA